MLGFPLLDKLNLMTEIRAQCKGHMFTSRERPKIGEGTLHPSSPSIYTDHQLGEFSEVL